jgi:hypothetical protein
MIDGKEVKHPIQGHNSCLPDPDALKHVGLNLDLSPEMLMRHLDERAHLAYRPRTEIPLWRKSCFLETPDRTELRIAVNQANHLSVVVDPSYIPTGEITDTGPKKFKINTGRNGGCFSGIIARDFNTNYFSTDTGC